jgi:isocitrate lyase
MMNGLKLLSLLTGSNEMTLLNARAEISHTLGTSKISNSHEKNFVLDSICKDIVKYVDIGKAIDNNFSPYEVVYAVIEKRVNDNDREFLVIFNRVMVHYYQMKLGNEQSLAKALTELTDDIVYIISNEFYK